jgi:hypothetical protein
MSEKSQERGDQERGSRNTTSRNKTPKNEGQHALNSRLTARPKIALNNTPKCEGQYALNSRLTERPCKYFKITTYRPAACSMACSFAHGASTP